MTLLSTVAALFLLFQASATGTINGSVITSATGGAVAGAEVTLIDINSPGSGYGIGGVITGVLSTVFLQGTRSPTARVAEPAAPGRPVPVMVTTGANGRFSFKQVNAGTFRITVASTGFARQEYGQRTANGPGTPINLTAGSTVQDLTIHLTPTGTVSGRISDELGQPAVDVPVQLVRVAFSPQGKTFQAVGSTNVNDRGEYRLYGISPGSYYLLAGNSPAPLGRPGRAEWAFDSHLCVELLSRRDGRQPGGADRSEEWIRSRRRHESAAGEYLSRSRTRYRFENRPSSAQSGHISELSQSHGRRRRLQLRTELQSSERNL